ncbi:hypothetical protein [Roseateles noduli]|uniref:hypothetical protein n=1 Tax=Roseateles noduli TaxID=2052484 RepID=UPI003D6482A3
MALTSGEISAGTIAYLDHELVLADPDIQQVNSSLDRDGPILCVQREPGVSVWTTITKVERVERLLLEQRWKLHGSPGWQADRQFLCDGLNTYIAKHASFVRAGANARPFSGYRRPRLHRDGVAAVLQAIKKRGGQLI